MEIKEFRIEHYDEVSRLWRSCEGVGLDSDVDTKERVQMYLWRNPGLSFVAVERSKPARAPRGVVGAVLCGHDGRRGYLHHLAVAKEYRNKEIGKRLVEKVLSKLQQIGIRKCNLFLYADNVEGQQFWRHIGWSERGELKVLSTSIQL